MELFKAFFYPEPTRVCNVSVKSYINSDIHCRNDSLVIYIPSKNRPKYEIVLLRPCNESVSDVISLCRCDNIESAELKFLRLADKLPPLYHICQDSSLPFLQRICDAVNAHPSWNIAHLAVELNLTDVLQNQQIIDFFHCVDPHDGLSPLQLAIRTQNVKMIQSLLAGGAPVDHFDHDNNSTLHYAAQTNKKILNMIFAESKNTLNSRNNKGQTPLHVACIFDNRECVGSLLEAGADVNISTEENNIHCEPSNIGDSLELFPKKLSEEDIKSGGTPLHWACSREVIQKLVAGKCNIDGLNFDRRTALHMMVLRGRLDCAVTLLCLRADMTIKDKEGRTALRMAVHQKDLTMVKALIAFNADVNDLDANGNTLRHGIDCGSSPADEVLYAIHAVGAPRCAPGVRGCTVGCSAMEKFCGVCPPAPVGPPRRDTLDLLLGDIISQRADYGKGRLLSLDGGGIRGLILIVVLLELEKAVGRPIIHCFDWVAGTSTGGILALALASGKSLQDCLRLYFHLKDTIFVGIRPYSSKEFELILKESFGQETTMTDIKYPKIMITATLMDRKPVDFHLFRNYPSPANVLEMPHDGNFAEPKPPPLQLLWEVARSTGAAPSYFAAFNEFVDGGLVANNPTLDAMTEIHEYNVAVKAVGRHADASPLSLVVSVGTGIIPRTQNENGLDFLKLEKIWVPANLIYGIPGIGNLVNVLVDQATQADGRVVDRARALCSMLSVPYYRFSPQISEDIPLDEVKNDKLVNMMWETRAYMHSCMGNLDDLIQILKR